MTPTKLKTYSEQCQFTWMQNWKLGLAQSKLGDQHYYMNSVTQKITLKLQHFEIFGIVVAFGLKKNSNLKEWNKKYESR